MSSVRKRNFQNLLLDNFPRAIDKIPVLQWDDLKNSEYVIEARKCYYQLGGKFANPLVSLPLWDVELEKEEKGVAIQLDEVLHFNQYREQTLRMPIYQNIKGFQVSKYLQYCQKYSHECLKAGLAGDLWTHEIAEKQFGKGEGAGQLFGKGSPAWKWRAFQDYLQDVSSLILPLKLIRVSVWEELMIGGKLFKLNDILLNPQEQTAKAFVQFISRKIQSI
ncbi:MAG: hypothetical protein OHK0038_04460 [Flammeovirgaceae bacterium]